MGIFKKKILKIKKKNYEKGIFEKIKNKKNRKLFFFQFENQIKNQKSRFLEKFLNFIKIKEWEFFKNRKFS